MSGLDWRNIAELKGEYHSHSFAVIRGFLSFDIINCINIELDSLKYGEKRKDFLMGQSNNSPRKMNVIGGCATNSNEYIMSMYRDKKTLKNISTITGESIVECDNPIENVIVTTLEKDGDTHGWHLDDYPIALIMCLEAPAFGSGGVVEVSREGGVEYISLEKGDAYLMRTDKLLHRVSPIRGDSKRRILNFTYSFDGLLVKKNGSAELLCT